VLKKSRNKHSKLSLMHKKLTLRNKTSPTVHHFRNDQDENQEETIAAKNTADKKEEENDAQRVREHDEM
jgi:hypothetical protein